MFVGRFGLRTDEQSVVSSSKAATAAVRRSVRRRRNPLRPVRARGQRAAATSLLPPSPVTPHPLRPQGLTPPVLAERVCSAAHPQEQHLSHPSGAPLRSRLFPLRPRSQTSPPRPARPACRGLSQAAGAPRECPRTPCPTTRLPATPRATRPQTQPLILAAWTAGPTWARCLATPTITLTPITHSWAPPPCRDTTRTTSGRADTTLTRGTAALGCPSAPQTVWITKIRLHHGNWTSVRRRPTAWTTKTRLPGAFRFCKDSSCCFLMFTCLFSFGASLSLNVGHNREEVVTFVPTFTTFRQKSRRNKGSETKVSCVLQKRDGFFAGLDGQIKKPGSSLSHTRHDALN